MAITSASVCFETRSAVPCARLEREDRGIRHELDVRPHDLGAVRGKDDRPVHLRELVEQGWRVVDLELDSARQQEAELLRLPDTDEGAGSALDDVVQSFPDSGAGSNHLQGSNEPRFLPRLELCYIVSGVRH